MTSHLKVPLCFCMLFLPNYSLSLAISRLQMTIKTSVMTYMNMILLSWEHLGANQPIISDTTHIDRTAGMAKIKGTPPSLELLINV